MNPVATCHCGETQVRLPRAPTSAKSCNCSFCARTGAVWAYFTPEEVELGAKGARTYSASNGTNRHHFCGRCGMHVWGDSPDWASVYNADGTPNARIVDDLALRASAGVSIHWRSPMGPIRFDLSKILGKEDYDKTETFRFSTSTQF